MHGDYICPTCGRSQHPGEKCQPGFAVDDPRGKGCVACDYGMCTEHIDPLADVLRKHASKRGNCRCGWKRDLLEFFDHADHLAREIRIEFHRDTTRVEMRERG